MLARSPSVVEKVKLDSRFYLVFILSLGVFEQKIKFVLLEKNLLK